MAKHKNRCLCCIVMDGQSKIGQIEMTALCWCWAIEAVIIKTSFEGNKWDNSPLCEPSNI